MASIRHAIVFLACISIVTEGICFYSNDRIYEDGTDRWQTPEEHEQLREYGEAWGTWGRQVAAFFTLRGPRPVAGSTPTLPCFCADCSSISTVKSVTGTVTGWINQ